MKSFRLSTPFLLLLPAIVVLVATIALPLLFSLYSSFTPFRLTRPETLWVLIGFRNYVNAFSDPVFWAAFGRTVLLLTIALNLEMLFGLGLALLIEKATRGQRLLRTMMMFPMMFSPILVGFQFKFLFNDNVGLVNNALQSLGITETAIPWLINETLAFISILVAEVWSSTPVFAILILAGLLAMPREPIEAAKVDGCTPVAELSLRDLAVHHAIRLHRDDHPLARRWPRLRHRQDHDRRRTGAAHRAAVDADRPHRLFRRADGRRQCDGLRVDPAVDSLHRVFLPQAGGGATADRGGVVR